MAYALTSAKLGNGEVVVRNDHIYVSPPWSMRDGTPYSIARIIEFLPPNAAHKKGARTTQSAAALAQANEVHVKISLFYRPSDISGRNISDFRLLLAAIHTDIQPLSNIRGKCYVRHKDRIDDLLAWKRKPDHFYFARFYDPYIKREFEVIRTESVNNIPQDVKEVLMSRYEYLITERDMIQDLTDTYKTCCVCEQWASTQEAVKCEACKLHYHMRCLNPPLLAKPAKGYSWVCPPCSAQRHKDVQDARYLFGGSSAPKQATKAAQKKEKSAATNRADVMFRGWPWRYFGQFTSARDTLDPDDLIFPRAATRVGQKFQATVPTWEVQQAAEAAHRAHQFVEGEAGPSRHIAVERGHDIGERKNESTYDIWCTPSADLNAYMQDVFKLNLPVDMWDVERLNRAVKLYTQHGRDKAYNMMRKSRLADFNPIIFSAQEQVIYETEQEHWGGIDAIEIGKLLKRPASDVLRFTYIWRCRKLHEENRAHRVNKDIKQAAHGRQSRTLGAPSLGRMRVGANAAGANAEDEDDDKSYYGGEFVKENKMQCAACSTRLGEIWWRCPRTVNGIAMCQSCGANYRKYGVISFTKAEDSKKPEKKDVVANKKGKGETSSASTPAPAPTPRQPPCACCKRTEPKSNMARCKNCTFSVHSGCYGIPSQDMGPNWLCELCHNAEENDNHLQPRCLLCPRDNSIAVAKIKSKRAPSDFDMLSALKPTEGRQWAHVLCSAWMSEIIYTQPSRMKAVEGITNLSLDRWTITCSLCDQLDGAVVSCTDCDTFFHPSCAWLLGYKFGFEFALGSLAPGKAGKRDLAEVTKFKEEEGVMYPGCWCKKHDLEGRRIYDAWDIDPEQNETALQIYTSTYKRLPAHDETFALLRKAQRLDEITAHGEDTLHPHLLNGTANGATGVAVSNGVETTVCASCGTDVSPRWYDAPTTITAKEEPGQQNGHPVGQARVCHICHFDQLAELEDASGGMEIDG